MQDNENTGPGEDLNFEAATQEIANALPVQSSVDQAHIDDVIYEDDDAGDFEPASEDHAESAEMLSHTVATNITIDREVLSPVVDMDKPRNRPLCVAPGIALLQEDWEKKSAQFPQLNFNETEKADRYQSTIINGARAYIKGNLYAEQLNDPDSDWRQNVTYKGKELRPNYVAVKPKPGDRLVGGAADIYANTRMKMEKPIVVPLWESGPTIRLSMPDNETLYLLEEAISEDKIQLGLNSSGFVYNNETAFLLLPVIDVALNQVYRWNVNESPSPELMEETLLLTDGMTLAWALAWSIYPEGFIYRNPCVINPGECNFISEELVAIGRMLLVDNARLTEEQMSIITKTAGNQQTLTLEEIKRYQSLHAIHNSEEREVTLSNGCTIKFSVPTIAKFRRTATRWRETISAYANNSLTEDASLNRRRKMMAGLSALSSLRMFSHWVESITYPETDSEDAFTETDEIDIERRLARMTSDDIINNEFLEAVGKFMSKANVSAPVLPIHPCPKCGKTHPHKESELQFHPRVVPQDMIRLFFTLVFQRLSHLLTNR